MNGNTVYGGAYNYYSAFSPWYTSSELASSASACGGNIAAACASPGTGGRSTTVAIGGGSGITVIGG